MSRFNFRNIILNDADGILIVDRNNMIRFLNPSAETLFGRKANELLNTHFSYDLDFGRIMEVEIIRKDGVKIIADMRVTEIELALFRIIQESLNNARKHAEAIWVTVSLDFAPRYICLTVTDNGKGFNKELEKRAIEDGHMGMIGMRERARLIGTSLQVDSSPGQGTTIRVEIDRHAVQDI